LNHLNRKIKFNKQYSWGCITPNIPLGLPYEWIKECDKDKNLQELKNKYTQIQFCDNLKKIINDVENICNIISSNFIALHIRSGDVASLEVRKLTLSVEHVIERYFPYEIACDIIFKNIQQDKIIIIFGDNQQGNQYLYNYVCKKFPNFTKSIFLSEQFTEELRYSDFEKAFFDLNLMSKAEQIIGPGIYGEKSGFSKLATIMSGKDIYNTYHSLYSNLEQYNIIKNNIDVLKNQHYIKSYAYIYLYHLGSKINDNKDTLIEYLKIAYKLDKDNIGIKIHYLDCLFNQEYYNKLDLELSKIIKNSNFLSLLLSNNCLHYEEQTNKYLHFREKQKYPYISFIAAHIAYINKDMENAKLYCSYALSNGNDVIFSDFYNYLNQNNVKGICTTTEAEKIKGQLSYRLGNTLVKHPFTFVFRVYGVYKKWRKERIWQ
ncbi:hypothetical protein EU797_04930, partial [Campylobacter jejuni]|nr:hypothetical protein [Campylobacter jejuni]